MKRFLFSASLLAMLASCSKDAVDDLNTPEGSGEGSFVTVTAGVDAPKSNDSRVATSDVTADVVSFEWETGDALGAVPTADESVAELAMNENSGTSATFSGTAGDSFYLVYPYLAGNAPHNAYPIDFSNQTNDKKVNCMVGLNSGTPFSAAAADLDVKMQHLGALMTVNLTTSSMSGFTLESLTFGDNIPVAGAVNLAAANVASCFIASKNGTIKVTIDEEVQPSMAITFDILPCTASNAVIRLAFENGDGDKKYIIYRSNSTEMTIDRAKSYTIKLGVSRADLLENLPINSASDLVAINSYPDADYTLKKDITLDCASKDWTPLCSSGFSGTFDGNGNKIKGLKIATEATSAVNTFDNKALFAKNLSGGTIKDVVIENCEINGRGELGGVVGYNEGVVSGCSVSGTINGCTTALNNDDNIGGVVGRNIGTIKSCSSSATVNGGTGNNIGGVVGYMDKGYCLSCYNTGNVAGATDVGGITGHADSGTYIIGCYNEATVESTSSNGGGIIGTNANGNVKGCYNRGVVTATTNQGGVSGSSTSTAGQYNFYLDGTAGIGCGNKETDDEAKVKEATEDQLKGTTNITINSEEKKVYEFLNTAIEEYNSDKDNANKAYKYTTETGSYPTITAAY